MNNPSSPDPIVGRIVRINDQAATYAEPTREQIDLLKRTVARGCTDDEFKLFLHACKTRRMDPLAKLIYPVKRYDTKLQQEVMALQSSIDSFRLVADRHGKYAGQVGPHWCGSDGEWRDVWLVEEPPSAARVGVLRSDFKEPLYAVALWSNYCQRDKAGNPTRFWRNMAPLMLAKCAEALALRRAFPEDLAGLYTSDEMQQSEVAGPVAIVPSAWNGPPPPKPKGLDGIVAQHAPPTDAKVGKVWSKSWQANPEKALETRIPVSMPMWNEWADKPTGLGPFVDKGHDTWRKVSRGSLNGFRHKMLLLAVEAAEQKPEEATEYHERAACTLAVLEWLAANKPAGPGKTETAPEDDKRHAQHKEPQLFGGAR